MRKTLKSKPLIDLLYVGGVTIGATALAVVFDLHEKAMHLLKRYESFGTDEITMFGLPILLAGLVWYGWRRWRESYLSGKELESEITLHRRTSDAFIETRTHLEELLISSPVVIYTCEPSGDFPATYISENIKRQLGHEPEEFLGTPNFWADHIHPEDAPRVFAEASQLFKHGKHTHEYRFMCKDGTYQWMRDELNLIYDTHSKPKIIVGYWIDITDRKQAEEAKEKLNLELEQRVEERTAELSKANERLKQEIEEHRRAKKDLKVWKYAIESSINGIGITDLEGKMVFINDATVKMWGYNNKDEILGKYLPEFWEGEGVFETVRLLKEKGEAIGEDVGKRKDGSLFIAEFRANMIKDEAGNPLYILGSFFDISGKKQAEEALMESEERYRNLFENSPIGLGISDEDGNIIAFNDSMLRPGGYQREDIAEKSNVSELYYDLDDRKKVLETVRRQGFIDNFETQFKRKDGTLYSALLSLRPVEVKEKHCWPALKSERNDGNGMKLGVVTFQ